MMSASPVAVLEAQALRVRRRWRDPRQRALAPERLERRSEADPTTPAWHDVLAGVHPLAAWLDGDEPWSALPTELDEGPSPRQLIASHPFVAGSPWSAPKTSPGF